jgi:hypothetical protein
MSHTQHGHENLFVAAEDVKVLGVQLALVSSIVIDDPHLIDAPILLIHNSPARLLLESSLSGDAERVVRFSRLVVLFW